MIQNPERLARFERTQARRHLAGSTHADALAWLEALWTEAAALNPGFPDDWRTDLEGDLAIARAINGLPPQS